MEVFKRLPFDIEENPIDISQWFNWPWSHKNFAPKRKLDLSYSVDFALPIETAIKAVKKGVVQYTKDNSKVFYEWIDSDIGIWFWYHCNLISIKDLDGQCESGYMHLAKDSIQVKVWDIVDIWDTIAYTGKSWWIWENPHLHFQYSFFKAFIGRITLPFSFADFNYSLEHQDILCTEKS